MNHIMLFIGKDVYYTHSYALTITTQLSQVYLYIYIICVYIYKHIHTRTNTHTCTQHTERQKDTHTHTHTHTHTRACIHIYIYGYTSTYKQTSHHIFFSIFLMIRNITPYCYISLMYCYVIYQDSIALKRFKLDLDVNYSQVLIIFQYK